MGYDKKNLWIKNKFSNYTHLKLEGTDSKAFTKTDIADTLGETFCNNSSSFNYSESFRKIKAEQEKVKLNFKSQNNEIYNNNFNLDELVEAIQLSHDSTTGPGGIHYQMLKYLPENSLETLLNIFNSFGLLVNFQNIGNMQQLFLYPNLVKILRNLIIIYL